MVEAEAHCPCSIKEDVFFFGVKEEKELLTLKGCPGSVTSIADDQTMCFHFGPRCRSVI